MEEIHSLELFAIVCLGVYTHPMNGNHDGTYMDTKISPDPKTVKMFRRLERFLDNEDLTSIQAIDFQNAETGRIFATFVTQELLDDVASLVRELRYLRAEISESVQLNSEAADRLERILEDKNAMLDIINLQNEIIQGRAAADETEACAPEVLNNVDWSSTYAAQYSRIHPFPADVATARER